MKVKIIWDTLADGLDKQINDFIQHKHVVDIKFSTCTDDEYDNIYRSALIMYENITPTRIKQKTFDEWANDDEINEFMKEHDVIKVEHFGDLAEVTTIITYREDKK